MAKKKALFFAATAQHVGKTTTCLGVVSGLSKRFNSIGFVKPVGQEHVPVGDNLHVDKDVVLFHDLFNLKAPYECMSPVILPSGFTRQYLDGEIDNKRLRKRITTAYNHIVDTHEFTVVEGTGHSGVGSIIDLSNADVAAMLDLEVILITTGGLGAAFDQLALNWVMFKAAGVKVRGIILNKVIPEKRDMVLEYIPKALEKWNVPLAGCIPYSDLLDAATMRDYENLFKEPLISGEQHRYRHFLHERLVLNHVNKHRHLVPSELIITHATRADIIEATLKDEVRSRKTPGGDLERGVILTGHTPPTKKLIEKIKKAEMPVLYVPVSSYRAMQMIAGFTAKIRREDTDKVEKAISLVEENINFDILCG